MVELKTITLKTDQSILTGESNPVNKCKFHFLHAKENKPLHIIKAINPVNRT